MRKVITMVLCNRPCYTKQVIGALKKCEGVDEYLILPFIEPGNDEVVELVRHIDFAEVKMSINPERYGGGRNTFQAWDRGFEISDFIVHVEDDTVPAPDCLRFMEYCRDAYREDQQIFSIASFNRYPCPPEQYYAVSTRREYTCWLVGIWKKRWPWAKADWSSDPNRYATHLANRFKKEHLREVYPLLSRVQNIGVENGIHEHDYSWHHVYHHTDHWADDHPLIPRQYFGVDNPLVTAVMVTGVHPDRYKFACMAIQCFKNQSYIHKNLLIINHGERSLDPKDDARVTEVMVKKEPGETIGDLRNLGLRYAKGDFLICWDDDDWHHPERIAIQIAARRGNAAVLLRRQSRINLQNDSGISIEMHEGIPNTLLYPYLPDLKYESFIRGEHDHFLKLFDETVVIDNDPKLHVCTYDGLNLLDDEEMMRGHTDSQFSNQTEIINIIGPELEKIVELYGIKNFGSHRRNFLSPRAREEHMAGLR